MTKKIRNKTLASIVTAVYILATMTACNNGVNSNNLSSDTVTTTVTDLQTPAPETTTASTTTIVTETTTTTEKKMETSATTPAPETTTITTTVKPETQTPAPEWDESKVSGTKYVNTACFSRKKAIIGVEVVKLYNVNDKVTVVAKTNTGYYKLDDGTFIHSDYLSDSKVVFTTTTVQTTTPKPQETPAPETEKPQEQPKQEYVTLYSQHSKSIDGKNNYFYSDEECTKVASFASYKNHIVQKAIKINDEVYKVIEDDRLYDIENTPYYVKASEFSPVKAYINPIYENYDIEGIKQRLIEIGTKEYGLVYDAAGESLDGTTWGFPDTINITMLPGKIESTIETMMNWHVENRHLDPGDTFAIYIEKDEYSSKYACTEEEFYAKQYYTIYVIDGGRW